MSGSDRRFVALLRGINVGKAKRLAMADLRSLLEDLGYEDVKTLLQSGNAVFTAPKGTAASLATSISSAIAKGPGLQVPVIVRSASDVREVFGSNPFLGRKVAADELSVAFVDKAPAAAKAKAFAALADDVRPDEVEVDRDRRVLYLRRPNGVMKSKLPDLDRTFGVMATERNWRTFTKLVDALS